MHCYAVHYTDNSHLELVFIPYIMHCYAVHYTDNSHLELVFIPYIAYSVEPNKPTGVAYSHISDSTFTWQPATGTL